jgi:hypothetical protein
MDVPACSRIPKPSLRDGDTMLIMVRDGRVILRTGIARAIGFLAHRLWGIFKNHRGLVHLIVEGYVAFARRYLSWQFGDREARWADVRAQDIWLYVELCAKGHTSGYAKTRLGALRRFLGFVHLRGA